MDSTRDERDRVEPRVHAAGSQGMGNWIFSPADHHWQWEDNDNMRLCQSCLSSVHVMSPIRVSWSHAPMENLTLVAAVHPSAASHCIKLFTIIRPRACGCITVDSAQRRWHWLVMSCHLFASQDVANAIDEQRFSYQIIIPDVLLSDSHNFNNPRYPIQGLTLLSRVNWNITLRVDHRVILSDNKI